LCRRISDPIPTRHNVPDYELKYQKITVNHEQYVIRSLKDRQQFDDTGELAAAVGISSASWPLFGLLWPSSRVLANHVSQLELKDKRVLEIGCGLGLSSLVLQRMGTDITASDYHPLAQSFLDENVRGNDLEPIPFQAGNWETDNPTMGNFDLIIGSDVLYEPAMASTVSRFIDRHSKDDVEVMIVDPNRGNRNHFTRNMAELGYKHHFERFNVDTPKEARCKGRILHYQRSFPTASSERNR